MAILKGKQDLRNAILIGGMCSLSYLSVYIARNLLSAVSPQMIENGVLSTENIGTLSSLFFILYAIGQLINGAVGDRIHAKYMICLGLALAAGCSIAFAFSSGAIWIAYSVYGLSGFFLAMIYGPMTKVVAENTIPVYTTRCSIGYTLASFLGTPLAGVLAMVLSWKGTFLAGSATLVGMSVLCFFVFSLFERKGIVQYQQFRREKSQGSGLSLLIRNRIVRFTVISMLTGIVRTSVVFWLPTYFTQHLGYSSEKSAFLFTVTSFLISASTFLAIFVYECLRRNMDLTIFLFFLVAALCFFAAYLVKQPLWNVILIVLAITASDSAASMLWARYCPGLRDTGMVSTATGFLDFASYIAAAVSSTVFAAAVPRIGWGGLVLSWALLMVLGVLAIFPKRKRNNAAPLTETR